MEKHLNVKQLPDSERPYERFLNYGPQSLSDAELLAIILQSGTAKETSLELSKRILSGFSGNLLNLQEMTFEDLTRISGIGKVKAIKLKAVAELSNRISKTGYSKRVIADNSAGIADYYMERLRHEKQETIVVVFFDCRLQMIREKNFSTGSCAFAFFPLQDILKQALLVNADSFVVLHNHPSGQALPSGDDVRVTERLMHASEMVGLHLMDHIIIGDKKYFSFKESKII